MIGFLRGQVASLQGDVCLLEVNGIGYRVFISGNTRSKLAHEQEAKLITHLSVREDALQLYGFYTQEEYDLFQLLLTVSGIGPKVALGILGSITPAKLSQAIAAKQTTVLTKLPGIGKKSAERMIVELKDKLHFVDGEDDLSEAGNLFASPAVGDDMLEEAMAALQALGFARQEITPVINKAASMKKLDDVQAIIKFALKELSGR